MRPAPLSSDRSLVPESVLAPARARVPLCRGQPSKAACKLCKIHPALSAPSRVRTTGGLGSFWPRVPSPRGTLSPPHHAPGWLDHRTAANRRRSHPFPRQAWGSHLSPRRAAKSSGCLCRRRPFEGPQYPAPTAILAPILRSQPAHHR